MQVRDLKELLDRLVPTEPVRVKMFTKDRDWCISNTLPEIGRDTDGFITLKFTEGK